MPNLLFSLRNVPDDEADEIRALLTQHSINFYETSAGNWGISHPAIWLNKDEQVLLAQQLLADYQQQRYVSQRQAYLAKQQRGEAPTLLSSIRHHPWRFLSYSFAAAGILYVSTRLIYALGF
jgi:hypothetical protein